MKKPASLILALSLLLTLTACGGQSAAPVEDAAQPADATAQTAQPAQPAETYVSEGGISYPISDGTGELTLWTDFQEEDYLKTQNDFPILPAIEKATGVKFTFIEASKAAASEQFNLMIASGEWPDLFNPIERYSGGAAQAYQDEVIIDLTDLLPTCAPDYWSYVQQLSDSDFASMQTTTDEGGEKLLYMASLNDCTYTSRGNVCRGDWLDELGYTIEDMDTLDEFTEVLYAVYDKFGCDWTLAMADSAQMKNFCAFQTAIPDITNTSSLFVYLNEDGSVVSGWTADEYREYLEWIHQLYVDKILNEDFASTEWDNNELLNQAGSGHLFMWETGNDSAADATLFADEANRGLRVQPVYMVYADDSKVNMFGDEETLIGFAKYSVTKACEDPELAVSYMNYFFTGEGSIFANYGEEGVSYTVGSDGAPHFTDLVLNNEVITNVQGANKHYSASYLCFYNHAKKLFEAFDDLSAECIEVWTTEKTETSLSYPQSLSLTTEESDAIINRLTDCVACAQERVLKFITGALEINDENWAEYCADMEGLGIQGCLDVYQTAYEEYLAGERKAGGGMPMGPGPGGPGPEGGAEGENGEKPEPPPM